MDPYLFAQLHSHTVSPIPRALSEESVAEDDLDALVAPFKEAEEASYHDDLKSFEQHITEMKLEMQERLQALYAQIESAQKQLQEKLDEKGMAPWYEAMERLRQKVADPGFVKEPGAEFQSIQEQCDLSYDFTDAVYKLALEAMDQKKYEEALELFAFLRFLNARLFEFWFGEACCLQALARWHEAIDCYITCLYFNKQNALIFFEMASCYSQLGELEGCLHALEFCIEDAKEDAILDDLRRAAEEQYQRLKERAA